MNREFSIIVDVKSDAKEEYPAALAAERGRRCKSLPADGEGGFQAPPQKPVRGGGPLPLPGRVWSCAPNSGGTADHDSP